MLYMLSSKIFLFSLNYFFPFVHVCAKGKCRVDALESFENNEKYAVSIIELKKIYIRPSSGPFMCERRQKQIAVNENSAVCNYTVHYGAICLSWTSSLRDIFSIAIRYLVNDLMRTSGRKKIFVWTHWAHPGPLFFAAGGESLLCIFIVHPDPNSHIFLASNVVRQNIQNSRKKIERRSSIVTQIGMI